MYFAPALAFTILKGMACISSTVALFGALQNCLLACENFCLAIVVSRLVFFISTANCTPSLRLVFTSWMAIVSRRRISVGDFGSVDGVLSLFRRFVCQVPRFSALRRSDAASFTSASTPPSDPGKTSSPSLRPFEAAKNEKAPENRRRKLGLDPRKNAKVCENTVFISVTK